MPAAGRGGRPGTGPGAGRGGPGPRGHVLGGARQPAAVMVRRPDRAHPPQSPGRRRHGGNLMEDWLTVTVLILSATLRVATPLILCALGALFCERSGLIDIGLEGK